MQTFGEPVSWQMVAVSLVNSTAPDANQDAVKQIKAHCRRRLQPFKVPIKIDIVDHKLYTERFKKLRRKVAVSE